MMSVLVGPHGLAVMPGVNGMLWAASGLHAMAADGGAMRSAAAGLAARVTLGLWRRVLGAGAVQRAAVGLAL